MTREELINKWFNGELSGEALEHFEGAPENQLLKKIDQSLMHFKAPDFELGELPDLPKSGKSRKSK